MAVLDTPAIRSVTLDDLCFSGLAANPFHGAAAASAKPAPPSDASSISSETSTAAADAEVPFDYPSGLVEGYTTTDDRTRVFSRGHWANKRPVGTWFNWVRHGDTTSLDSIQEFDDEGRLQRALLLNLPGLGPMVYTPGTRLRSALLDDLAPEPRSPEQ